ncbi:uncharacterized protein J4E79_002402 [Alternaria viburni]|uniref:uncharacterized protein n=1 Tax=Alternaria viburni TaxID=566460 RepID=UPI0020C2DF83|nr:uncharacterized protein J4E79_002402 [Alternaria viburni]KAI4666364.1 hypothetical protein J4E79_002402 [Alternaria viburni]
MAQSTVSRSDRENHFRFLDLPAELRNCIYEFAAETEADQPRCVLPCLALAQTCQQLRTEYRPVCMKREIIIDWKAVTGYLHHFFPNVDGKVVNAELVPKGITVVTPWRGQEEGDGSKLDLLPIIKVGLCRPDFTCRFVHDKTIMKLVLEDGKYHPDEFAEFVNEDSGSLGNVVCNRNEKWLLEIATGVIKRIILSNIGVYGAPQAEFYMNYSLFSPESDEDSEYSFTELYFKSVGLFEAWTWDDFPAFPSLEFEP